jgi:hypothetical protein
MIITKEVLIKNNGRIKTHYKNLGLDVSNEYIVVDVNLLTKGSHAVITTSCDICNLVKDMLYKTYLNHTKYDGVYYCSNCSLIKKEKILMEKYGVKSYTQTTEFKDKTKKTCLEKYGHEFYQNSNLYKEKVVETCLNNYGCRNVMQNKKIFEKQSKSSYRMGFYNDMDYQGTYELDFLENYYDELNIEKIDPIKYFLNESSHYYHPDFYLPDYNLIIEIKSSYTYNYDIERNITKKKYSIENGYNFIFIIDKDYSELNYILGIT